LTPLVSSSKLSPSILCVLGILLSPKPHRRRAAEELFSPFLSSRFKKRNRFPSLLESYGFLLESLFDLFLFALGPRHCVFLSFWMDFLPFGELYFSVSFVPPPGSLKFVSLDGSLHFVWMDPAFLWNSVCIFPLQERE